MFGVLMGVLFGALSGASAQPLASVDLADPSSYGPALGTFAALAADSLTSATDCGGKVRWASSDFSTSSVLSPCGGAIDAAIEAPGDSSDVASACAACLGGVGAVFAPRMLAAGLDPTSPPLVMSCLTDALPAMRAAGLAVDELVVACQSTMVALGGVASADDGASTPDLDGPPRVDRPRPSPRYRSPGYPLTGTTRPSADETTVGFGSGAFGLDGFVYSPRCDAVAKKYNRSWTPGFLRSSASACVVGDVCSVDCLRDTRGFLDEFTALGCEMEPIRYGVERSAGQSEGGGGGAGPSTQNLTKGAELAVQMAEQLDGVQRMIDALMPTVDAAVDDLACTRNDAGHYCLLFTEALNAMMAEDQLQQRQAAVAAAAAGRDMDRNMTDALAAEQAKRRCAFYEEMGCCAPMVVGVGYRAATAVQEVMGVKLSTRAAAYTTADIIRQIQAECEQVTGGVISSEPCSASDAHMTVGGNQLKDTMKVIGDPLDETRMTGEKDENVLSGGAIAAIVLSAIVLLAVVIGAAFVMGQRKAKQVTKTIQLQDIDGRQLSAAATVVSPSSQI